VEIKERNIRPCQPVVSQTHDATDIAVEAMSILRDSLALNHPTLSFGFQTFLETLVAKTRALTTCQSLNTSYRYVDEPQLTEGSESL
jgi:hypothetical protein